jgi:hypothetical protein
MFLLLFIRILIEVLDEVVSPVQPEKVYPVAAVAVKEANDPEL